MMGHKICFYGEIWPIIPVTPSCLEHCVRTTRFVYRCTARSAESVGNNHAHGYFMLADISNFKHSHNVP